MKRQELENWLIGKGYTKDIFGHYQRTIGNETVRFKMQATSVRYERGAKIVDHSEWLRLASGYYKDLNITEDDKLRGTKGRRL